MALALPARTTRRLIMQKAGSHPNGLLQFEGAWVQVLFHSPRGVLFTFPSRYWFAIGRWLVFSLGGWALRIQAGFHVSRPTWDAGGSRRASRRGLSPAAARLSRRLRSPCFDRVPVPQPRGTGPPVWAISAFARRYLRNRVFLLLLRLLRCFTSPGLARSALFGSCTRGILWDAGFPHSETSGSKTACVSPELIAACRVLRRLPPPRHPPCARTVWTPESCAQAALASRPHGITRNGGLSLDRARGNHGPASVVLILWKKFHRRRLVDMRRPRPVAKEVCRIRDPT